MTVGEIFQRLANGEKLKDLESEMGRSVSWIQRRLKAIGYEWDNSGKVWNWIGEGEQPLEVDLGSYINNTTVTQKYDKSVKTVTQLGENDNILLTQKYDKNNTSVTQKYENNNTSVTQQSHFGNTVVTPFSNAEISSLRDMIKEWQNKQTAPKLSDASALIPTGKKGRRSIYAREDAFKAFDQFCNREGSSYDKGDLFSLALMEFVKRYGRR